MARPSKLTKKCRDELVRRLAGGESLSRICLDAHMPTKATVLLWVVDDRDGFHTDYMRAREAAGFAHADQSVDVARRAEDGDLDPQAARAALAGYHWAAERMAPKRHSPRQEITGEEGGPVRVSDAKRQLMERLGGGDD